MKLSKIICFSALTLISTSVLASTKQDVFYLAAGLGVTQTTFNNTYLDQTDFIRQNIAQSSFQNGYLGSIAIGYSRILTPSYCVGVEMSANKTTGSASVQSGASTSAFSDQINIDNHFDFVIVPGFMITDTLLAYLKLGLSYAMIEDNLSTPTGFAPTYVNYHDNTTELGFTAGLGVAKLLTDHVSIFAETNYYDFGKINLSTFQNFTATYSHTTHAYTYDAVIGFGYSI